MLLGREVTVVGAGIGGLTLALALARRGARVRVLEQANGLREAGAGLQVSPNGMAVLAALDVGAAIEGKGLRAGAVELIDGAGGRRVTRLDLGALPAPQPWLLVHRADLVEVIGEACRESGVVFRFGATVDRLSTVAGGVRLNFADGTRENAPLVVGADGIRSRARAVLEPGVEPVFTGQTAWRALVPLATPDPAAVVGDGTGATVRVFLGAGRHLVAYPLRDGRLMNIVAVRERDEWLPEGWSQPDDAANLRAAFSDFADPVDRWLARAGTVHLWGLHKHRVAPVWHRGRLAILGDAAHATLPFLAQGACMAIEDAWVLAQALDAETDTEVAFARYQAVRQGRCARIVAAADANARAYHLRGPVKTLGHTVLRIAERVAPHAALNRFAWLYGHDVTRG